MGESVRPPSGAHALLQGGAESNELLTAVTGGVLIAGR
jgi:hypothetical protein